MTKTKLSLKKCRVFCKSCKHDLWSRLMTDMCRNGWRSSKLCWGKATKCRRPSSQLQVLYLRTSTPIYMYMYSTCMYSLLSVTSCVYLIFIMPFQATLDKGNRRFWMPYSSIRIFFPLLMTKRARHRSSKSRTATVATTRLTSSSFLKKWAADTCAPDDGSAFFCKLCF